MQVTLTANFQVANIDQISKTIWNLGLKMIYQYSDFPNDFKNCSRVMKVSESADSADASCCQYIRKLWIRVLSRHMHTTDLINMGSLGRPYGTEILNVQSDHLFLIPSLYIQTHMRADTLTCGDRAVGGWVKSVEWAADRRPCALLTVWRVKGADSTSCWGKDTNTQERHAGDHHRKLKVETTCLG